MLRESPELNEPFEALLIQNKQALYQGVGDADSEAGTLSILGGLMPRNELSHFYNPEANTGYRAGRYVQWIPRLEQRGWLSRRASLLLGPTIASTDMVNWYYASAIQTSKSNKTVDAIRALGYAAHIVMDSTVPQHVNDCGDENAICGLRRYEQYLEQYYDDWALGPVGDGEVLTANEIQDLTSKTPDAIVKYGASESKSLLDLVKNGASESNMEDAARYLIPLAQQLVAALILRFVADFRNSEYNEEAVVLQLTSIELDGESTESKSPCDFQPVIKIGNKQEARGYMVNSNFVYMDKPINSHEWTFVQLVKKDAFLNMDEPVVTFELEIHDVKADGCGKDCGVLEKRMVIGTGGQTSIQIHFALDHLSREAAVTGSSSGCNGTQWNENRCQNAVKVEWTVGRSFLMQGYTEQIDAISLSFTDFITPTGLQIIVFSFLAFALMFLILVWVSYCCVRRRTSKKSRMLQQ